MGRKKLKKFIIYTDGGARGNPGPAGIGVVIKDENGNILKEYSEYIGTATNNQAEYRAVLKAFDLIEEYCPCEVDFYLDSELVAKQLSREYKIKNPELAKLFVKIWNKQMQGVKAVFHSIPRDQNKHADRLVNQAIDRQE